MNPSVVIVDDHELFRAGVRSELAAHVEVVGDADGVESAVPAILATAPDVVLLDVHMPGGGGVEVIRQVAKVRPEQRFLALSVSDPPDDVIAVIRAGARGYVTKSITPAELADAVRRVADGDAVFSPRLAGFVLDAFAGALPASQVDPELDQLTAARARGPPAHRARVHVQGDRAAARHQRQDGGGPRQRRAAQAPALQPPRAQPLGGRAPARRLIVVVSPTPRAAHAAAAQNPAG